MSIRVFGEPLSLQKVWSILARLDREHTLVTQGNIVDIMLHKSSPSSRSVDSKIREELKGICLLAIDF
jgi:hypothetical protein